jgi:ADP-heptose:LPS heptosyltransferase
MPFTPYCVIQLGAAFDLPDTKNWPMSHWQGLIQKLAETVTVVLVGSNNEAKLADTLSKDNVVNLIGKTALNELAGIIKNSVFFLGVDSGIGHISGALNNNTLILWGPTDFVKSHQVGSNTHFINLEKSCSPCRGPSQMGLWSGPQSVLLCAYNKVCMKEITVEKVYEKLQELKWL